MNRSDHSQDTGLTVNIRPFTMADYDAVLAVWREAGLPFRPQGRDAPAAVEAQLHGGSSIYLIAEAVSDVPLSGGDADGRSDHPDAADAVVGVVFGTHDGRKGWINRLAVLPAFQGRGIARRLVAEVEARLSTKGIDIVAASIESENEASLGFFGAIGYLHDPSIEYVSKRRHLST